MRKLNLSKSGANKSPQRTKSFLAMLVLALGLFLGMLEVGTAQTYSSCLDFCTTPWSTSQAFTKTKLCNGTPLGGVPCIFLVKYRTRDNGCVSPPRKEITIDLIAFSGSCPANCYGAVDLTTEATYWTLKDLYDKQGDSCMSMVQGTFASCWKEKPDPINWKIDITNADLVPSSLTITSNTYTDVSKAMIPCLGSDCCQVFYKICKVPVHQNQTVDVIRLGGVNSSNGDCSPPTYTGEIDTACHPQCAVFNDFPNFAQGKYRLEEDLEQNNLNKKSIIWTGKSLVISVSNNDRQNYNIIVSDIQGNLVTQFNFFKSVEVYEREFNLEKLKTGAYFVKIYNESKDVLLEEKFSVVN